MSLIEVNTSPSMAQEYLLDEQVKQPVITDALRIVDAPAFDRYRLVQILARRLGADVRELLPERGQARKAGTPGWSVGT